ncbi:lipoprotein insertase outer membrane protein LolB [Gallaecimonas sp. GXIMD4217]|uniref:lipoprotein insertase outer membrane protein LolB n=1 Tax=Gallaecimonas sp. GXIMD4217 TaxID=3131927 RepID=UPI00311ABB50
MKKTLLLLPALLLTACVGHQPAQWPKPGEPLTSYEARGKVALISPEGRDSANLLWQNRQQQYRLTLTSFIGTHVLTLKGQPNQVSLETGDGTFEDTDAEYLLYRLTGWQLPVEDLPHWLQGQPGDTGIITEWDEQRRPRVLAGGGWRLRYQRWQQLGGRWLPARLELVHEQLKIKLQINQWQPL